MEPWVGHGKTRKRCQLRKKNPVPDLRSNNDSVNTASNEVKRTRRGRIINQPTRYRLTNMLLQRSAPQQGEGCKQDHESRSREERARRPRLGRVTFF